MIKVIIVGRDKKEVNTQKALDIATIQLDHYKRQEQIMLGDLGRAGKEICKYAHKVGRLQEENEQLKNERLILLQHIERSIVDQKVELPYEVASALYTCMEVGLDGLSILTKLDVIGQLFRDYNPPVLDALGVIRAFTMKPENAQQLLSALVNDYTVARESLPL